MWTARLLLESTQHKRTYFVTLTYAPEHLPTNGTLVPEHLQKWLKRIRKAVEPHQIRFFAVGEYGEKYQRPHYHALIFGPDIPGFSLEVQKTWPYGFTQTGLGSVDSITYVAGYVLKKLVAWKELPPHLVPEFARMSRRPGIGAGAIPSLAQAYNSSAMSAEVAARGDVLDSVRLAGAIWPTGRFVKTRLRDAAGYPETDPTYRLIHMLNRPLLTAEEKAKKRRESLARSRRIYRSKTEKAKL